MWWSIILVQNFYNLYLFTLKNIVFSQRFWAFIYVYYICNIHIWKTYRFKFLFYFINVCIDIFAHVYARVWKPLNNLRCHSQKYCPLPLKQGPSFAWSSQLKLAGWPQRVPRHNLLLSFLNQGVCYGIFTEFCRSTSCLLAFKANIFLTVLCHKKKKKTINGF